MKDILQNKTFAALFEKMRRLRLTLVAIQLNGKVHSLAERDRFGQINGCSDNVPDADLLISARLPERFITVLAQCGVVLALVNMYRPAWFRSSTRRTGSIGQGMETSKRRGKYAHFASSWSLTVKTTSGWMAANEPTTWFIEKLNGGV